MKHSISTKIFIGTITVIAALSCDPVFWTKINNKSGNDIIVEIQFDKTEITSVWQNRPFLPYLEGRLKGGGVIIKFDTISLVSDILLKPSESFKIEGVVGFRPDFFGIKKISIFKNDTIVLDNKEIMIKSFKETSRRQFNLDLK